MASVTSKRGRRLMGEINVVPYIDVMLVLLIIFMVTAPMLSQGIKVDLPKAAAEPLPPDIEPLVLSIDAEGGLYLNIGEILSVEHRIAPYRSISVKLEICPVSALILVDSHDINPVTAHAFMSTICQRAS